MQKQSGFTLIELLIVISLIVLLASVVFVALNPLQRFQDARNATRITDVTSVVTALKVDQVDNGGAYLTTVGVLTPGSTYMIYDSVAGSDCAVAIPADCNVNCAAVTSTTHSVDLRGLVTEGDLGKMPISPNAVGSWSASRTGYALTLNANNSVSVEACDAEGGATILVTQ